MLAMTYRIGGDDEAHVALMRQRARMEEQSAALRAERLRAAAEREERSFSQPGLLARLRSRRGDTSQRGAGLSVGSRP